VCRIWLLDIGNKGTNPKPTEVNRRHSSDLNGPWISPKMRFILEKRKLKEIIIQKVSGREMFGKPGYQRIPRRLCAIYDT